MKNSLIAAMLIAATACADPVRTSAPDLSIRAAKPSPPPPAPVTVISLGTLPFERRMPDDAIGLALNNGTSRSETRVAGVAPYQDISMYPFTWTLVSGMSPVNLGIPAYGWATGVSDYGVIVGETSNSNGNHAFVATATTTATFLPVPSGTTHSAATGISADGACVSGSVQPPEANYAALWRNGALEIVGYGSAAGVTNDCLAVAGTSFGGATVWTRNGSVWNPETLPFTNAGKNYADGRSASSTAADISPNGEYVAGYRVDSAATYAVVWHRATGAWIATDLAGPGVTAFGVDNSGRVVGAGNEPMLWTPGSSGTYTGQMLPPLERSTRGWANAINELGQITGRSFTRKGPRAVMWTIN